VLRNNQSLIQIHYLFKSIAIFIHAMVVSSMIDATT